MRADADSQPRRSTIRRLKEETARDMNRSGESARAMAEAYDEEAEATGWRGPEVAFCLAAEYICPGQSILDIGIGTGLGAAPFREAGLVVYGMDVSLEMLDACRTKGFTNLSLHDLTQIPYPFDTESVDHALCIGVLQFFCDLSAVFEETSRILRPGGLFAFVVGDRSDDETRRFVMSAEETGTGHPMTMYRHSVRQIEKWAGCFGFALLGGLPFDVYADRGRTRNLPVKCYLVRKTPSDGSAPERGPGRSTRATP